VNEFSVGGETMNRQRFLKTTAVVLVGALLLTGCNRAKGKPLALVFVIDMTASTDAEGRAKAFRAVQTWFEQKRLRRGDKLTVIPVTGDALTESQGRILRFNLSERREAYDGDLRRIGTEVLDSMARMEKEAADKPYQSSDILGAVRLGAEELEREGDGTRKALIVLSDFVQDDAQARFKTSPYLAGSSVAEEHARKLASARPLNFKETTIYLGLLRSTELKPMTPARREAIAAFWTEYFHQCGAKEVISVTDGPGQIDRILTGD
jgi:hypothetical protein